MANTKGFVEISSQRINHIYSICCKSFTEAKKDHIEFKKIRTLKYNRIVFNKVPFLKMSFKVIVILKKSWRKVIILFIVHAWPTSVRLRLHLCQSILHPVTSTTSTCDGKPDRSWWDWRRLRGKYKWPVSPTCWGPVGMNKACSDHPSPSPTPNTSLQISLVTSAPDLLKK